MLLKLSGDMCKGGDKKVSCPPQSLYNPVQFQNKIEQTSKGWSAQSATVSRVPSRSCVVVTASARGASKHGISRVQGLGVPCADAPSISKGSPKFGNNGTKRRGKLVVQRSSVRQLMNVSMRLSRWRSFFQKNLKMKL